jgi:hypothetical protein
LHRLQLDITQSPNVDDELVEHVGPSEWVHSDDGGVAHVDGVRHTQELCLLDNVCVQADAERHETQKYSDGRHIATGIQSVKSSVLTVRKQPKVFETAKGREHWRSASAAAAT